MESRFECLQIKFYCNTGTLSCVTLLLLSHFSRVQLCMTPQTAAHQAPPSLGFSRHYLALIHTATARWVAKESVCPDKPKLFALVSLQCLAIPHAVPYGSVSYNYSVPGQSGRGALSRFPGAAVVKTLHFQCKGCVLV